jgi:hypothetical protein
VLIGLGIGLILLGVLAELLGGTSFRGFFEFGYGRTAKLGWRDDVPVKILLFRAALIFGVVLVAVGILVSAFSVE